MLFISHHIGDLENLETTESFNQAIQHFEQLFRVNPKGSPAICTRITAPAAMPKNVPVQRISRWSKSSTTMPTWLPAWQITMEFEEPVIGVCFDGTGLGTDGAIWGGEFLLGGYASFTREYHLAYIPLPGGDAAISKPPAPHWLTSGKQVFPGMKIWLQSRQHSESGENFDPPAVAERDQCTAHLFDGPVVRRSFLTVGNLSSLHI